MKRLYVALLSLCVAPIVAVPIIAQAVAAPATAKTAVVNKSPQAIDIIHKQGQFIFTDGSSSYIFKKDGTFKSYPLGLSGRMIEGTWKSHNQGFLINGVWSWVNGISPIDDRRKMTLIIYPRKTFKTVKFLQGADENKPIKIYDCYFEFEELVKVPKKATSSTN